MIQDAIKTVVEGRTLTALEAESAMGEIMAGAATSAQIAGLAVAMRVRGETAFEVAGFARAMRAAGLHVTPRATVVADTCGTGGDGKRTLNVSTGAALVAAGAGVTVAKHGNRAMSSRAGSADVLEALGVKIDAAPPVVERGLNETGMAFCFAQVFHPAMKHAGPPRRELGVRTIFNLLGPLTNPAGAGYQVIGVAQESLLDLEARALAALGTKRSLVVHSRDGLDELTVTAPTRVVEVAGKAIRRRAEWKPSSFGFKRAVAADLAGGTPEENAQALLRVLRGQKGAYRDAVLLNAGAVCWLTGRAKTPREGVTLAARALDRGAALTTLERLKALEDVAEEAWKLDAAVKARAARSRKAQEIAAEARRTGVSQAHRWSEVDAIGVFDIGDIAAEICTALARLDAVAGGKAER